MPRLMSFLTSSDLSWLSLVFYRLPHVMCYLKSKTCRYFRNGCRRYRSGTAFKDWGDSASQMRTMAAGLSTILQFTLLIIYGSHHIRSKISGKSATTRSFRIVWLLLGALVFIHYIAFMSNISLASILVGAGSGICAIYYCSTMLTACKQLYMEGLPTSIWTFPQKSFKK